MQARLPDASPHILSLADNGGGTQTHALVATSPAINRADPNCPVPTIDQRGIARSQGVRCDMGAFEWETPNRTIFLGSSTSGSVGGVNFADDDILSFNMLTLKWNKYFDGSDVGLAMNDVKAFVKLSEGDAGIYKVRSASTDIGTNGIPYNEWSY